MKKQRTRLVLAKETLKNLGAKPLEHVAGADYTDYTNPNKDPGLTGTGTVGGTAATCLAGCGATNTCRC